MNISTEPVHFVDPFIAAFIPAVEPNQRRTPSDFSRTEIAGLVLQLIFIYSTQDVPAVVLRGYDTIRNIPSLEDLLGIELKEKVEWPTDWEMVYDTRRTVKYGPHKGELAGDLSVLLDIQVSNKLESKAAKMRQGYDTIRSYFKDPDHEVWSWLLREMEAQLPGISIAGL